MEDRFVSWITDMGATENTIFAAEIRAVLNAGAGKHAPASSAASDVLATFNFKKASSLTKLKIFKKKLEAIIVAFETYIDPLKLPEDSVRSIKDALNYISIGFYPILEDRSMESTTITILEAILEPLQEAQSFMLAATTLLDEKKSRGKDYYRALLDCRKQMFEVRKLLKALKLEPT